MASGGFSATALHTDRNASKLVRWNFQTSAQICLFIVSSRDIFILFGGAFYDFYVDMA